MECGAREIMKRQFQIITRSVKSLNAGVFMKYKVVGWTYYEDESLESGDVSSAIVQVIVDDIVKNGYLFSGEDHQESFGCVPVLNTGKKYLFSRRSFGAIMAMSQGEFGDYDYACYTEYFNQPILPSQGYDQKDFENATDLCETICVRVAESDLAVAKEDNVIVFDETDELKYVDNGDTLRLVTNDQTVDFIVTDVTMERCYTDDELNILRDAKLHYQDLELAHLARVIQQNVQKRIKIKVAKTI